MAKILGNPVLDALRAAGIADDNTPPPTPQ
jgi:hypothetical protein